MATIDYGSVVYANPIFEPDVLTFSGADTLAPGTILGRLTSGGKLVPFAIAGDDGSENPVAVLTYEVVAGGSGDIRARVLIGGEVVKERLIVDADGDISNLTQAHVDALRAAGVTAVSVTDLAVVQS